MGFYWLVAHTESSDAAGIGGNRGIGKELVRLFLKSNAKVYMASRNWDSALAAITELEKDTGREAIPLHLDLSSLRSCQRAAEVLLRAEARLDILINGGYVCSLIHRRREYLTY